ncbi:hypothetical protein FALCPG4_000753 [Fusarium falciforme]
MQGTCRSKQEHPEIFGTLSVLDPSLWTDLVHQVSFSHPSLDGGLYQLLFALTPSLARFSTPLLQNPSHPMLLLMTIQVHPSRLYPGHAAAATLHTLPHPSSALLPRFSERPPVPI